MILKLILYSVVICGFCTYQIYNNVNLQIDDTAHIIKLLQAYGIDFTTFPEKVKLECVKFYRNQGIQSLENRKIYLQNHHLVCPSSPETVSSHAQIITPSITPETGDLLGPSEQQLKKN